MTLFSKFHPLLVHFPIALVLAAAAAELVVIATTRQAWRTVAVANIRAGAAMGVVDGDHGLAIRVVAVGRRRTVARMASMAGHGRRGGRDRRGAPVVASSTCHRSARRSSTASRCSSPHFSWRSPVIWVGRSCGVPDSFNRNQRCRIDKESVCEEQERRDGMGSPRVPEVHGVGRHRRGLDDDGRRPQGHADRAGGALLGPGPAGCASCRSATATSASTRPRIPTSPRRCARRSRRSTRCRSRRRSCCTPAISRTCRSPRSSTRCSRCSRGSARRCSTCPANTTC